MSISRKELVTEPGKRQRYAYLARVPNPRGEPRTLNRQFATKREAEDWESDTKALVRSGSLVTARNANMTFGEYVKVWRANRHGIIAPGTAKRDDSSLNLHIMPWFENRRMSDIHRLDCDMFATSLRSKMGEKTGRPLSAGSIRNILVTLRAIFAQAVEHEIITRTPYPKVTGSRTVKAEIMIPTDDQVDEIIAAMPERYQAAVTLAADSGLRVGELVGLSALPGDLERTGGVDFLRGVLYVRVQGNGAPLKSSAGRREIPLAPGTVAMLADHLRRFPTGHSGMIFTQPDGSGILADSLGDVLSRRVKARGFPLGTRWHIFRHYYASSLIREGLDPKTVQAMMGHATIAETMNTYAHLWPDAHDRVRDAIQARYRVQESASLPPEVQKSAPLRPGSQRLTAAHSG